MKIKGSYTKICANQPVLQSLKYYLKVFVVKYSKISRTLNLEFKIFATLPKYDSRKSRGVKK